MNGGFEMNIDNFDTEFEIAFEEASKQHEFITPDHSSSWNKIKVKMDRRSRWKKIKSTYSKLGIIAASILLGAIIFGMPTPIKAFSPFFTLIKSLPGNVVEYVFGSHDSENNTKAKTEPPPDVNQGQGPIDQNAKASSNMSTKEIINMDEAKKRVSFQVPETSYIPDGFTQLNMVIFSNNSATPVDQITINYIDPNGKTYKLVMSKLKHDSMITSGSNKDSGSVEEVTVNSGKAYLTIEKNQKLDFEFMFHQVFIVIVGDLTKDEVIKIANGLK
jgi:hypothetical protein